MNRRVHAPALFLFLLLIPSVLFSQDLDRRISLKLRRVTLEKFLAEVSRESGILFSYTPSILPEKYLVTVDADKKPVREILEMTLSPAGLTFRIVENQVVIARIAKTAPQAHEGAMQPRAIRATLAGVVREKGTGEVLIGAHLRLQGTPYGAVTNAYGYYSLSIPGGEYRLAASYLGYKGVLADLTLNRDTTVNIELEDASLEMKEVEIVSRDDAGLTPAGSLSEVRFTAKDLAEMPGFAGDIDVIKSLQVIPGISSFGDGSSFFFVRGGNSDQNLFMIDDAPIYNPSHLFGFFSVLSPDAINEVKAYKGDFPAQYGGRLSSVIDIKGREGNMNRYGFSGNIGPYASYLSVEGPIMKGTSSFLVTGRLSTLDWLPQVVTTLEPYKIGFYDLNAKVNLKINPNNRIFLTFFTGNDNFSGFSTSAISTYGIRWTNLAGTVRWNHLFSRKLFSNTTASISRYQYFLYISKELNEYWQSSVANLSVKSDLTWFLNPSNTVKTGLEVTAHAIDPGNVNEPGVSDDIRTIPRYQSMEYVFYASNEQKLGRHFILRYGLRLPVWQDIGPTTVYTFGLNYQVIDSTAYGNLSSYQAFISPEPRISLQYSPVPNFSLKAAYSRNTQFMQVLSNSSTPFTSLEVWVPAGPNVKPQKADQVSAGFAGSPFKGIIEVSGEVFYKLFSDHLDYRDHANLLNNPYLEGELRFGKAWSYGVELMLRKPAGKVTGWIAYTWSRALVKTPEVNDGQVYPAVYDRPNDFSLSVSWTPVHRFTVSANWILMSGGAVTTPVGFYYINGYSVPIYGEKNTDRLPWYHRLDLSFECRLNKPAGRYRHSLILTLYNAYGRLNPYTVSFNKFRDDQGEYVVPANQDGTYTLVPTAISVAGIIPSINYQFKF